MNKLSKHVLGMKFMRRTKDQVVTDKTESTFRQHFSKTSVKGDESTKEDAQKRGSCEVIEVKSYSQCEGHIFGRQSFGGFNPVVEANVSKGIWKPCYLDSHDAGEDELSDGELSDSSDEEDSDEVEVKSKDMAKSFGSLVGTLGKKFLKKRDRGGKPKQETEQKNKRGNNKKGKETRNKNKEQDQDEPPNKKLKFMKPTD